VSIIYYRHDKKILVSYRGRSVIDTAVESVYLPHFRDPSSRLAR